MNIKRKERSVPTATLTSKGQITISLAQRHTLGFTDLLVLDVARAHGWTHTASFDKNAARPAGMKLLV